MDLLSYVHTKPNKFENRVSIADKMFSKKVLKAPVLVTKLLLGSKEFLTIIVLVKRYKITEKCVRSYGQSTNTFIALLLGYTLEIFMMS